MSYKNFLHKQNSYKTLTTATLLVAYACCTFLHFSFDLWNLLLFLRARDWLYKWGSLHLDWQTAKETTSIFAAELGNENKVLNIQNGAVVRGVSLTGEIQPDIDPDGSPEGTGDVFRML